MFRTRFLIRVGQRAFHDSRGKQKWTKVQGFPGFINLHTLFYPARAPRGFAQLFIPRINGHRLHVLCRIRVAELAVYLRIVPESLRPRRFILS